MKLKVLAYSPPLTGYIYLKALAFIDNFYLIWDKTCFSSEKSKLLIMFKTKENAFLLVQYYTSFVKVKCLKQFEPI